MDRKLRFAYLFIGIISGLTVIVGNSQPFVYGYALGLLDFFLSSFTLDGAHPELSGAGIVFWLILVVMLSAIAIIIFTIYVFFKAKKPHRRKCIVLYIVNCVLLVLAIVIGRSVDDTINKIKSTTSYNFGLGDLYYVVHKADGVILIVMLVITVLSVAYMKKDAKME